VPPRNRPAMSGGNFDGPQLCSLETKVKKTATYPREKAIGCSETRRHLVRCAPVKGRRVHRGCTCTRINVCVPGVGCRGLWIVSVGELHVERSATARASARKLIWGNN